MPIIPETAGRVVPPGVEDPPAPPPAAPNPAGKARPKRARKKAAPDPATAGTASPAPEPGPTAAGRRKHRAKYEPKPKPKPRPPDPADWRPAVTADGRARVEVRVRPDRSVELSLTFVAAEDPRRAERVADAGLHLAWPNLRSDTRFGPAGHDLFAWRRLRDDPAADPAAVDEATARIAVSAKHWAIGAVGGRDARLLQRRQALLDAIASAAGGSSPNFAI